MKFRSRLVVNLQNLKSNYLSIKKMAPDSEIIFMVKADGYGHGMIAITRYAITELGIKEFGCASIAEALNLRLQLNDLTFDIYVFSDIQLEHTDNLDIYLKHRIMPIISAVSELDYILHMSEFQNSPICLEFNTGMNRLGLDPNDAPQIVNMLKRHGRLAIHHLFSHYANANLPMDTNEKNIFQHSRFFEIKKFFIDSGIILERTSQSNSGSIEQKIGFTNDGDTHIRPGLMMYGPTSLSTKLEGDGVFRGKIISKLETYIIRTFNVQKGETIGYGSTACPHDGVVVILAIGYGDGFSTHYGGAHLYHNGFEGKIIGRVNMDMTQVLFPTEARNKILAHDIFTIWGEEEGDLAKFSEETNTIPYEIFCSLLPRIPRIYRLE